MAPELLVVSDWERHALVADLRGSYTGYSNSLPPIINGTISPAPTDINRPDFIGENCCKALPPDFGQVLGQGAPYCFADFTRCLSAVDDAKLSGARK